MNSPEPSDAPEHLDHDNLTKEEYLERLVWTLERHFEELVELDRDKALDFIHAATDVLTEYQIDRIRHLFIKVDDLAK